MVIIMVQCERCWSYRDTFWCLPYETSTTARTIALSLWSNMSDVLNSFLKSADPAKTRPETLGRSAEMKHVVAVSATYNDSSLSKPKQ